MQVKVLILLLLPLDLHCTPSLIICHLVRSPREPDSPLPHTSCNHLHQCKASAKHYHMAASRKVWLRLRSTTLFRQTEQRRMRLKSFREGLSVRTHTVLVCTRQTALVHLFVLDLRMPSCRPVGREISLCLQSSISVLEKTLLWLNIGQGRLRCDSLSIQVTRDDEPETCLQQQSLRCYVPAEMVVGCRAWPHLAIHWCHWQSKRTGRLLPVSRQTPEVS